MSSFITAKSVRIVPRDDDFLDRRSGSGGEIFYDRIQRTLRVYDGDTQGGASLAKNDLSNVNNDSFRKKTADAKQATVTYIVKVVAPQAPDVGNKYSLNNVYKPELNFVIGYTYIFDQTDLTNVYFPNATGTTLNPHPLNFSDDDLNGELGNGESYLTDVKYYLNDLEVSQEVYVGTAFNTASSRQVRITVTNSTPSTLYYWCWNHVNMGNEVSVAEPGTGGGGNTTVSVSETVPAAATSGNLWLNTNNGRLYVYINDGTSNQWIQPSSPTVDLSNYVLTTTLDNYATVAYVDAAIAEIDGGGGGGGGTVITEQFELYIAGDDSVQYKVETANLIKFVGSGTVTTSCDVNGVVTITGAGGGGDIGSFVFTGTNIDTNDSSGIIVTPAVTFQSDAVVENELTINNNLTVNANAEIANNLICTNLIVGNLLTQGSGIPEIISDSEIYITPGTTTILNGLTTLNQTTETINSKAGATGTVDHDFSSGSIFYHTNLVANFTANIINVPTTDSRTIAIALFLDQGATAYIPNALQIDGVPITIKWSGGSVPSGTNNYLDLVNFTLIRISTSWVAIGSLSTYN